MREGKLFKIFAAITVIAVSTVLAQITVSEEDWLTSNEITITTARDLRELARRTNIGERNGFGGVVFTLANDIDVGGEANPWVPIVNFQGTFDGNGNIISGIFINTMSSDQGLFGIVGNTGVIRNIGVVDVNITGGFIVGGLVGSNSGRIENCFVVLGTVSSDGRAGGLAGESRGSGLIINSYADVNVYVRMGTSFNVGAGGLVGWHTSSAIIENSFAIGNISRESNSTTPIGGLVGQNGNSNLIINSYALESSAYTFIGTGHFAINSGFKTEAELKQMATFDNWDFDKIWGINDGVSFPFLRSFDEQFLTQGIPAQIYTGSPITVPAGAITVLSQGAFIELEEDKDYELEYFDNIDVGTARVEITGIGEYAHVGTRIVFFTINPRDVSVNWTDLSLTYDQTPQTPTATSSDPLFPLGEVVGGNQINIGEYNVSVDLQTPNDNIILHNTENQFTINPRTVEVVWSNTILEWSGSPQAPTATATFNDVNYPVEVQGQWTARGEYNATAVSLSPNIVLENTTTRFTIVERAVWVDWRVDSVFVFDRTVQFPNATARHGDINIPISVATDINDAGARINAGWHPVFAVITGGLQFANYRLANPTHEYEIQQRPITVLLEANQSTGVNSISSGTEKDTIVVVPELFADSNALKDIILALVDFDNFAVGDNANVFTGEPTITRFVLIDEPTTPSPAPRSSLDLLRYRIYLLTINTDSMTADNYRISDTTFVIRTTDYGNPTFIRTSTSLSDRYGILLENAVVSDMARISVITPEPATVNLAILDNLGNVVFSADGVGAYCIRPAIPNERTTINNVGDLGVCNTPLQNAIVWNLINNNGRFVANGAYLIIAETIGISGRRYLYSARIGVNR